MGDEVFRAMFLSEVECTPLVGLLVEVVVVQVDRVTEAASELSRLSSLAEEVLERAGMDCWDTGGRIVAR